MFHRLVSALRASSMLPLVAVLVLGACDTEKSVRVDKGTEKVTSAAQAVVTLPSGETVNIDHFRSLLVVDQEVRDLFSFEEVMTLLAQRTGMPYVTPWSLYQQWWDTNNSAGMAYTSGPHCVPPPEPYNMVCPRQEGAVLANPANTPFGAVGGAPTARHGYHALALVNRFDLAPADGAHCGEYRIIFAKNSGKTRFNDRLLLNFEMQLPNPTPAAGLEGCRPVAEFWARLSNVEDVDERGQALRSFYLDGLPGFAPVVHPNSLGLLGGQIRANQFMFQFKAQLWQLKEYKFVKTCTNPAAQTGCKMEIWNTPASNNPEPRLFSTEGSPALAPQFQADFLAQMPSLLGSTVDDLKLNTAPAYNTTHSDAFNGVNDYTKQILNNPSFQDAITARLAQLNVTDLSWRNITDRATTQSCAGCHLPKTGKEVGGGVIFPPSNIFTHVDEVRTETVMDELGNPIGTRPLISPALKTTFLPLRKQALERFLNTPVP